MRKSALLKTLLLGFLLLFAHTTQAQKTAGDYWPMKTGSSWKLYTVIEGHRRYVTLKVIKVVKSGNELVSTVTQSLDENVLSTDKYRITPGGIYLIASGKESTLHYEPNIPLVKFPMKDGDSWDWQGKLKAGGQQTEAFGSATVSGPETIKTPAGTYKAMKVHLVTTVDVNGQKIENGSDFYFAPGVGPVRQIVHLRQLDLNIDVKLSKVTLKK